MLGMIEVVMEVVNGNQPMACGTLVLISLYRELHDICYHGSHGFGYVTSLQVWTWEHIVVTQLARRVDKVVDLQIVYSYQNGLHYEEIEDIDHWRVIFDKMGVG